ncbi:cell division protein ZapA [Oribacterium sinus]|uniref:cell division protein ZapA n=1 Tax=Oribacterium sinus TaxID=237576 RepID=UPI0028E932F8|nr:cell division protein ZapA [Oribacterium sinus]
MADKKTIQVIIDGKIYVLSGENSESYLHDVADYLNHKIESIRKEMWNYNKLEESVRSLLLQINICDELFQERKKVEEMQELLDQEKSESYSYKHDLVKTKLKLDGVLQELESTQKKLLALEKKEAKDKISHEKSSHEKSTHEKSSHQGSNKEE